MALKIQGVPKLMSPCCSPPHDRCSDFILTLIVPEALAGICKSCNSIRDLTFHNGGVTGRLSLTDNPCTKSSVEDNLGYVFIDPLSIFLAV